jgi:Uma2 family endonuclease
MAVQEKLYTADEFWKIAHLPENFEKRLELIDGVIVEMAPAGGEHGEIGADLLIEVGVYVKSKRLGRLTTAETGFVLYKDANGKDTVLAPDIGFVSMERAPERLPKKYVPFPPDFVVEIVSPNDRAEDVQEKLSKYRKAGVRLMWFLYPSSKTINVHTPDNSTTLGIADTLDGGDMLPGFTLPVRKLFEG